MTEPEFKMARVEGWNSARVDYFAKPAGPWAYVDHTSWVPARIQYVWYWLKRLFGRLHG